MAIRQEVLVANFGFTSSKKKTPDCKYGKFDGVHEEWISWSALVILQMMKGADISDGATVWKSLHDERDIHHQPECFGILFLQGPSRGGAEFGWEYNSADEREVIFPN